MLQYHDRAVVERLRVVGQRVDRGPEWSRNHGPGFDEKINPEVHSPALVGGILTRAKLQRGIQWPNLIVAANGYARLRRVECLPKFSSQRRFAGCGWIGAKERAGDAEIEHQAVVLTEALWNDRCRRPSLLSQPILNAA